MELKYPFLIFSNKSSFKFYWDLLITILIFVNSLLNPLEIAFQQQNNSFFRVVNLVVIVFYLIDIFLSMRTTYFDRDNDEILAGTLLFKQYIQSRGFFVDLISAIPLNEIIELSVEGSEIEVNYIKFINLLKFIRLLRLSRIFFYFQDDSYKIIFQIARISIVFVIMVCYNFFYYIKFYILINIYIIRNFI